MNLKEISDAIPALDAWFESQEIEDKYAAVVMAELLAFQLARNFGDGEAAEQMVAAFKVMLDKSMSKYIKGKDKNEAKRPY